MEKAKAIELLRNAVPAKALPDDEIGFFIEAVSMAISALEKAPTALDHIHNVVAENERKRGYEQSKAEYDAKLEEIKSRFKDHYYLKGYEQGKADANHPEIPDSWIPVSERLPEEGQGCLVCDKGHILIDTFIGHGNPYNWKYYVRDYEAWMPLPEPWEGEQHETN